MSIRRAGGILEEALTHSIIGAFFEVHNILGFGFLESVYVAALENELRRRGHAVAREVGVRVLYKGDDIAWQRLDMLVDGRVVIEAKTGPARSSTASSLLLNYLRASRLEIGLLFHFGPRPKFLRVFSPNESPDSSVASV